MPNRIVGFGDSFIYGDGLETLATPGEDPTRYRLEHGLIGWIGKELGLPTDNHGLSGASLGDTVIKFRAWLDLCGKLGQDPKDSLVIVGLTNEQRETFIIDEEPWVVSTLLWDADSRELVWPRERSSWDDFIQHWVMTQTHARATAQKYWLIANFFDSYCTAHGIPLFMFNIFDPIEPVELPTLFPKPSILDWTHTGRPREEALSLLVDWPRNRHHNSKGYQGYAKVLTAEIKQRKLA
jgi:hypothetical protein